MVIQCASSVSKSLITREAFVWFTLATRPPSPNGENQQFASQMNAPTKLRRNSRLNSLWCSVQICVF